ncbi:MAG: hypothetical protein ACD_12C00258G0001, partial [uncultured bacterium]
MIKQINHPSPKIKKSTLMLFIFVIISICFFIFELYLIEKAVWEPKRNEINNITAQGLRDQINQLKKKINQFKEIQTSQLPEKRRSDDMPIKLPQSVNFLLTTSVQSSTTDSPLIAKGQRIPVFILSTIAGSGCDYASELNTTINKETHRLTIDILGYDFTKGKIDCVAVVVESRKKIPINLNWLKSAKEK